MIRSRPDLFAFGLAGVCVIAAGVIICFALAAGATPADAVKAVPPELWVLGGIAIGGGAGIANNTPNPPAAAPAAPAVPQAGPPAPPAG